MRDVVEAAKNLSFAANSLIKPLIDSTMLTHITNPLDYAWECHFEYIEKYSGLGASTLLLGMNPGPWGMAQCGIPFGATLPVKNLLGINHPVLQPVGAHPKRPVIGLDLERQEASGTRLWSLLNDCYGGAKAIHRNVFLVNHCPLLMLNAQAQNITPDKISGPSVQKLMEICDQHLVRVVESMGIKRVIGVGKYAEKRAKKAISLENGIEITSCWHPSPASPLANRNGGEDWRKNVRSVLFNGV